MNKFNPRSILITGLVLFLISIICHYLTGFLKDISFTLGIISVLIVLVGLIMNGAKKPSPDQSIKSSGNNILFSLGVLVVLIGIVALGIFIYLVSQIKG